MQSSIEVVSHNEAGGLTRRGKMARIAAVFACAVAVLGVAAYVTSRAEESAVRRCPAKAPALPRAPALHQPPATDAMRVVSLYM
jgi:hypothetical protein